MTRTEAVSKICVALDVPNAKTALTLASQLRDHVGMFKVGLQLYTSEGPGIIRSLRDLGVEVFLDLKFHDIPNTVAGAASSITPFGVSIFNVHASGGVEMMKAALKASRETAATAGIEPPRIIAITVLTSFDELTYQQTVLSSQCMSEQVPHFARLTQQAGLAGVVASPQEIGAIRSACGKAFLIVTPGIRPSGADVGDQKRVSTPCGAILAGADMLVIGRPITSAADPERAAEGIVSELQTVCL
jgi:orotidine-5'-phosphate decarboxylase